MQHADRRLRVRRFLTLAAAAIVVAAMLPASASAHAFLILSTPEAGARLTASPRALTLHFSEPFVGSSERISIRRVGGAALELARPTSGGAVVRQALPPRLRGIFVASWSVLSDDGHVSQGQFAFAVRATGALPSVRASGTGIAWSQVVASWLVFLGLALALGGLVSDRLVWKGAAASLPETRRAVAAAGASVAAIGALGQLVLLAGDRRGRGFGAGLDPAAFGDVIATRPGRLTLAVLVAATVAAALIAARRVRLVALLPLVAAIVLIAELGHSGTSGRSWALLADVIHLLGAALWVGALVHLVIVAAQGTEGRAALVEGARRYSRLALPLVIMILGSGVVTAIPEFRSLGAVTSSSYGRTLLIKAGLIGAALALALTTRRRALPGNPRPRLSPLRRLTAGEATVLVVVLGAVAVLVNSAPPRTAVAQRLPQLGPPAVTGPALRIADLAGQLVVGVTAAARGLQFTVLPPGDESLGKVRLTASARLPDGSSVDLRPLPCGRGCFSSRFRLRPGMTQVRAAVSSSSWQGGSVRFAIPWLLPPERPGLVRRVAATMRALPSLTLKEAITSGPSSATAPTAYTMSGRRFMQTEVFGGGGVDVRRLSRRGNVTELAFAIPASDIWYRIWIDRRYRLRRELILDPGHRIFRTFSYAGLGASTRPSSPSTPTTGTPPPPRGAVALGREDGDLAVGLAVRPGRRLTLQATVLGPAGGGLAGLDVGFRVRGTTGEASAQAIPCGGGCYRAHVAAEARPAAVTVTISGVARPPSTVAFALPASWPAPSATRLVARATSVFRRLRSLVIHERLASSPTNVVTTTYEAVAPNRLAYQIRRGPQAIVIGDRRWDRNPGGRWKGSAQTPLRQPVPFWTSATDAHVIGSTRIGRRPARLVSFYDPNIPAFFTIAVDKATSRTLDLRMTAAAHFMHHRYSGFDRPITIKPPAATAGG